MLETKEDLKLFLAADKYALNRQSNRPDKYDFIWKFEILLRYAEYYNNRCVHRGGQSIDA